MPHCQKEFAKPPVSSKKKKEEQKAKREAEKKRATKKSKDDDEEEDQATVPKDPEQEAAEREAAQEAEKKEAEAQRLKEAKVQSGAAFKARNWEVALANYSICIEIEPEDHVHWSNRAAAHMHLENFEEALADATKSTEIKPDFAKGWARAGTANAALEKLDEAEVAFQQGLTLEPENAMCSRGLKDVQKKREGPTEAEAKEDMLDALVKELHSLELTDLQSRCLEEGLNEDRVEEAKGSEDPKTALVNLVVAYRYLTDLITAELKGLRLPQLRERALEEGLDEAMVEEAASAGDPKGALKTIIVKHISNDLVDVVTEASGEMVEESDEESEHCDDEVDFEVVTVDESELQLGIGEVFLAGAYIDDTYGELVLPNGTRLGNRALSKFYKQRMRPANDRQLALRSIRGINAKIARREHGRLLSQNASVGLKSALASQPLFKQNKPDNKATRAIVHHWGAGGGGSHYHSAGGKQYNKGNKVKGVVLRHSVQGAKLQAARNKANRGKQSIACLQ